MNAATGNVIPFTRSVRRTVETPEDKAVRLFTELRELWLANATLSPGTQFVFSWVFPLESGDTLDLSGTKFSLDKGVLSAMFG